MSSLKVSDEEHAHDDSAGKLDEERDETRIVICLSCCGLLGLGALIGLIILLCSIHHLGPEDQVVISGPTGKYVRNGPQTVVLAPERKKVWRQPVRLTYNQYVRVKNTRSGAIRHEAGPKLLFLGAYDVIEKTQKIVTLQKQQYLRLVDRLSGSERVLVGPKVVIPKPFEIAPTGVEDAPVVQPDTSFVINNKTTGLLKLVTQVGLYYPKPYEYVVEVRKATLLGPIEYAVVKDGLTGTRHNELGPQLLQVGAYEKILHVATQIILRKDEYVRLKSERTGTERVVRGPKTFAPDPFEKAVRGKEQASFIDTDSAVLVLDKNLGQQRLITEKCAFFPNAYEEIIEVRPLIRLMPQESVATRSADGQVAVFDGMTTKSFFLPPHWRLFEMKWSSFSDSAENALLENQMVTKVTVTKVDKRVRKMLFWYDVRTSDNVELRVGGVLFWQVTDVLQMIGATGDPEGDVWHRARSSLIQAVSRTTLQDFMLSLDTITNQALDELKSDGFFTARGVYLETLEVTSYDCVRSSTAKILEEIIMESTERVNRLQKQESYNEVAADNLTATVQLEKQRTQLITTQATNAILEAAMLGDYIGLHRLGLAKTFIGGLNESVPDIDSRVDLYKLQQELQSQNNITAILAASEAKLFVTPEDLGLTFADRGSEL